MAHLEIHRVADSFVPRFRDTFLTSIGHLRSQVTVEMVAEDMRAPDNPAGLFALLDSMQIAKGDVEQRLYAEIALSGASVAIGEEELRRMLTLDSPKMQQAAREMAGTMIKQVTEESKQAVRQIITEAFAEGNPPAKAQKTIRQVVGLTKRDAIAVKRFAEAQPATTPRLLSLADKRVERYSAKLLRRRALSIARTECLPAEMFVDRAVVRAAFRRWYEGSLIEVRTRSGRKFTATPNHPVLTDGGWTPLGEVTEGDDLICHPLTENKRTASDQDIEHPPATIGEICDTLSAVGVFERRRCAEPDFHGDGWKGDIDVFTPNRELRIGRFTPLYKPVVEDVLSVTDQSRAPLCLFCHRLLPVDQTPCFCEGARFNALLGEPEFDGVAIDPEAIGDRFHRFAVPVAPSNHFAVKVEAGGDAVVVSGDHQTASFATRPRDSGITDYLSDRFAVGGHGRSHLFDGETGEIQLDRVLTVRRRAFRGHVFNLTTPDGYFSANGVYTGNTITASNRGLVMGWEQMADEGLIDRSRAVQRWLVTFDDRTCPRCAPMSGKTVRIGGTYTETERGVLPSERVPVAGTTTQTPALHPSCRCSLALDFT